MADKARMMEMDYRCIHCNKVWFNQEHNCKDIIVLKAKAKLTGRYEPFTFWLFNVVNVHGED